MIKIRHHAFNWATFLGLLQCPGIELYALKDRF